MDRYTNDGAWPPVGTGWVTLPQAVQFLKAGGMKQAVELGMPGSYLDQPFLPRIHKALLEGCPEMWLPYLIPFLMTCQGNPVSEIIEQVNQMSDLPRFMGKDRPPSTNSWPKSAPTRPSLRQSCQAAALTCFSRALQLVSHQLHVATEELAAPPRSFLGQTQHPGSRRIFEDGDEPGCQPSCSWGNLWKPEAAGTLTAPIWWGSSFAKGSAIAGSNLQPVPGAQICPIPPAAGHPEVGASLGHNLLSCQSMVRGRPGSKAVLVLRRKACSSAAVAKPGVAGMDGWCSRSAVPELGAAG